MTVLAYLFRSGMAQARIPRAAEMRWRLRANLS